MTPATLAVPAPTLPLSTLIEDRNAISTAITALRYALKSSNGRDATDYGPYLASAEARLVETEAAIAKAETDR